MVLKRRVKKKKKKKLYYLFTPYSVTSIQASPGGPVNILYLTHVLNYWPIIYHNSCQWKLNNALQDFTTSSCCSWPRRRLWPFKVGRRSMAPIKADWSSCFTMRQNIHKKIHENEDLTKKELLVIAISVFECMEAWMMSFHLTRKSLPLSFWHSSLGPVQINTFCEKPGSRQASKNHPKLSLKTRLPVTKDNKGGSQAVKMFISPHNSSENHLQLHPSTFCDGCNARWRVWSEMQVARWAEEVFFFFFFFFPSFFFLCEFVMCCPPLHPPHYHTSGSCRKTTSIIQPKKKKIRKCAQSLVLVTQIS